MQNNVIENINFEERRELVLLKALTGWVKMRFAGPMNFNLPNGAMHVSQSLHAVDTMKKVGIISDDDAWLIEQNSLLFSVVIRSYLHDMVDKEIFAQFGEVRCGVNRKGGIVDIALLPIARGPDVAAKVVPCTMYVTKKEEISKKFNLSKLYATSNNVDVIPLVKSQISNILPRSEEDIIVKYYNKYKTDPDTVKSKATIIEKRASEDRNLKGVLNAINQGKRTEVIKLAVAMYTIIKKAYKSGRQNINKIKFDGSDPEAVPEFSRIFYVDYDIDLEEVKTVLGSVVDPDLKIRLGGNRLLFTTVSKLDPDDDAAMEKVVSAKIMSEQSLDDIFESHVGPQTSIDDVRRIMDKFLQMKYN